METVSPPDVPEQFSGWTALIDAIDPLFQRDRYSLALRNVRTGSEIKWISKNVLDVLVAKRSPVSYRIIERPKMPHRTYRRIISLSPGENGEAVISTQTKHHVLNAVLPLRLTGLSLAHEDLLENINEQSKQINVLELIHDLTLHRRDV